MEIDGPGLADELFRSYLQQIWLTVCSMPIRIRGCLYHRRRDGSRMLDVGMVGRLIGSFHDNLLRLLLAISEGRAKTLPRLQSRWASPSLVLNTRSFVRRVSELVAENTNPNNQIDAGQVNAGDHENLRRLLVPAPTRVHIDCEGDAQLDRSVFTLDRRLIRTQ
jgi:hypothetical protein